MEARNEAQLPPPAGEVLASATDDLLGWARGIRDQVHGRRVTWSPKVFIPLTMLCRDRCGYCTFAQAPARLPAPFLSPEEVVALARAGVEA
ncbi:MAG TPA: 7,8-didemethyl-8-hydroxy-5-deazariboflavin synthase, partial [Acidimicrobiales bacterium]|nr:7,8-didemethyl-8-hydroxy-5-deazariboflavin synthase [Acidimicrobiales bacterium]